MKSRPCQTCTGHGASWRRWYVYIDGERIKCEGFICFSCALSRDTF